MSAPLDLVRHRLADAGCRPKGTSARCPAHEDRNASLSIGEGRDGQALVNCHKGCAYTDVIAALDLTEADLFPDSTRDIPAVTVIDQPRQIVARYPYVDEHGQLLYEAVRYSPKAFRQRRPDGRDGWQWKLGDTRRVPYHLPQLLEAVAAGRRIFVVEGEKDVHRLEELGLAATCNAMGAGKWRPEYGEHLTGAHVAILPDNDEAGRIHAQAIAHALHDIATSVRIVELPGAPPDGGDVSDWLDAGGTIEQLEALVEAAPNLDRPANPVLERHRSARLDWSTFWTRDRTETEWLVEPLLPRGRAIATYSPAGQGKSLLSLDVAARAATGRRVLDRPAGRPTRVLYLDLEMTEDDVYERLQEMGYGANDDLSTFAYYLLPSLPPLDKAEGGAEVRALAAAHDAELVVIDTTSRVLSGPENDSDTMRAFHQHTGLLLKSDGRTVWRLDHAGKDLAKGQRGTSAKNDDVDIVWQLLARDGGALRLRATKRRVAWVPEALDLIRREDPLRHEHALATWPAGTKEAAALLEQLSVPLDHGRVLAPPGRPRRRPQGRQRGPNGRAPLPPGDARDRSGQVRGHV